jgi:hypothetical protein
MKCAMRLEAHALRPLKQCVALHEVYESIAGAFDGAKMRNESNAFLKRSAAAFVASERFLGLTPIGELMLERDGVEAVAWSADLLREGGVGGGGGGGGERGGGGRGEVRLLPIRPRSRGARRSLRTFPVVNLHPRFPFNV